MYTKFGVENLTKIGQLRNLGTVRSLINWKEIVISRLPVGTA
jgi:hypothetical protein